MATVSSNLLTKGFSGSLGPVVFRQLRGKTIIAGKPDKILKKQSAHQRQNRDRFKAASIWAKQQMLDEERKKYYWHKAKKLKVPNAYTAAVCDYMRKGEVKEVDTRQYKGNAGDVIKVMATKKDFAVNKVQVTLYNAEGVEIESGMAVKKAHGMFFFKTTETVIDKMLTRVSVEICDHYYSKVMRDFDIG
jgi:hypothetical protein